MSWIRLVSRKRTWITIGIMMLCCLMCGLAFASGGGGGHGADDGERVMDLLYRAMNFALLVIILFVVIRKTTLKDFFAIRREEIKNNFEELNRQKALAEERYRELAQKLKEFEASKKEIIEQYKLEGEQQKKKIIAEAEKRAAQILEQAEVTVQQEFQAAGDRLKQDVLDSAARHAQEILLKEIKESDQDHLVDEFINSIQSVEKLH